jgi:hypothetical protein
VTKAPLPPGSVIRKDLPLTARATFLLRSTTVALSLRLRRTEPRAPSPPDCFSATTLAFDGAGNLFVGNGDNVTKITPGGAQSNFASGLGQTYGLAFNSAGDLFDVDISGGNIYKITPDGTQSLFASGLAVPWGLAINSDGDLFVTDPGSGYPDNGNIYEYTPEGLQSTFASGLDFPSALVFQPAPEPSALGLLAVGVAALYIRRRRSSSPRL